MSYRAEYIWIDGQKPTAKLRSKTKVLASPAKNLGDLPEWGFDGSSTSQASGHFSDLLLRPVKMIPDPLHHAHFAGALLLVACSIFISSNRSVQSRRCFLRLDRGYVHDEMGRYVGVAQARVGVAFKAALHGSAMGTNSNAAARTQSRV